MDKYECVIIDDDEFALNWLKKYINAIPGLCLKNTYINPVEALLELQTGSKIDLIILDIDMPLMSGIELSKEIRSKTRKLIFSTAYKQYGYDAFEVEADAYLLKPYTLAKFAGTIGRLFQQDMDSRIEPNLGDNFFFVKNKDENLRLVKVKFDDVVAVESKQNYVLIHTLNKKILTYMSLTEISKTLRQLKNFVQFQRSFIIGKSHIESIDGNTIRMVNGLQITVGDYYKKEFQIFLTEKLIKAGRKL